METNVDLLNQVAQALVAVLTPIVLGFVVAALKYLADELKAKVSAKNLRIAQEIVSAAVKAAEQTGLIGELKVAGQIKKQNAIAAAQAVLNAQGIKLDVFALEALIEAAVFDEFNTPLGLLDN